MNKSELKEFTAFFAAIAEVYSKKVTDATIMIYFDALADLELSEIKRAVKAHCNDSDAGRYFPLVANIRAKTSRHEKNSLIAWSEVCHAMEKHGSYSTVQFEDGIINSVIHDMGGWPWICVQNLDEPWTQKEFERRYESYKSQDIESHTPLIGLHEGNNRKYGFLEYIPPTILIGDGGQIKQLKEKTEDPALEFNQITKILADKFTMPQ
jgi:hypothetical protein